jgi:hypothetical protein
LRCPDCHHRIAWTTFKSAFRHSARAWRWQGKRVPIHYRIEEEVPVVDLECFRCGWQATYPIWEVQLAAKVLMAPETLAKSKREVEQRYAEAS